MNLIENQHINRMEIIEFKITEKRKKMEFSANLPSTIFSLYITLVPTQNITLRQIK